MGYRQTVGSLEFGLIYLYLYCNLQRKILLFYEPNSPWIGYPTNWKLLAYNPFELLAYNRPYILMDVSMHAWIHVCVYECMYTLVCIHVHVCIYDTRDFCKNDNVFEGIILINLAMLLFFLVTFHLIITTQGWLLSLVCSTLIHK